VQEQPSREEATAALKRWQRTERNRRWRQKRALKLMEMRGTRCEATLPTGKRCPEDRPAALQWHHKAGAPKTASLANLLQRGAPWSSVLWEAEQCLLLCATCHAVQHAEERERRHHERGWQLEVAAGEA
jgi:hypothetical protein